MKLVNKHPLAILIGSILATGAPVVAQEVQEHDHTHENLERIVVTASPLDRTAIESAQPIYVLSGDALRESQAATLGETLRNLPGLQSTYYSPTSSSPVIRGLDGPRVRILQNGLDVGDVSRGGPDHAVSVETSTAEQIEVLRGPATLLYGSGASGGVVNVVDNRVPRSPIDRLEGSVSAGVGSAANERTLAASLRHGTGDFAFHIDGFKRDADDYRVPEFVNPDGERTTLIENSFTDDLGGTIGASYIGSRGFIGASYGRLEREYGIPGHSHDHDDGHDHGHADDDDHGHEHGDVFANMVQDRVQVLGQLDSPLRGIERVNLNFAYTDLTHEEVEGASVESAFSSEQTELRITARHQAIAGWRGAFGIQARFEDYQAYGAEAFTPSTETDLFGAFWLTERSFGDMTYELGARAEHVRLSTSGLDDITYRPISASAGMSYRVNDELRLTGIVAYSERAPQAAELFSNGSHYATRTYDIGGVYEIHGDHSHDGHDDHHDDGHAHGGDYHLAFASRPLDKERSSNIDLGAHYDGLRWHLNANVYYNRIDNFIYNHNTGLWSSQLDADLTHGHEHGDGFEHGHDHSHEPSGLMVYQYAQVDAELYGYEVAAHFLLNEEWHFGAWADSTRAKISSGGNLPRIPAQRTGLDITYKQPNWDVKATYTQYWAQNDVAEDEATTDSFGILSAYLNFYPQTTGLHDIAFYLKAENLSNRLGYVHNSFIRDHAPLPGMNIGAGVRITF